MARVAILASAHGFGHLTRQLAVGEALVRQGAEVTVFTAAPAAVVRETLPEAAVMRWAIDVGVAQRDSVTEDLAETRRLLAERHAEGAIDALARALRGFDRVIADIPPVGLEAARRAGVPALAVGSFTWPWIYRRYADLEAEAARLEAWQAPHPAAEILPGPGLEGFASVEHFGLVGRTRPAWRAPVGGAAVLVSFGGFGLDALDALLPRLPGVTWVTAPPTPPLDRDDVLRVEGVPYPALVAGADAVLTKPGYSILAEAALAGTRLVWIDRGAFPEAPWLEAAMIARGDRKVVAAPAAAHEDASVAEAVASALASPRPPAERPGEAERLAARALC